MPTWVLLVAVCLLPVFVCLIGGYLGWDPHAMLAVVWVADVGPVTVLASRVVITWGGDRGLVAQPNLPAWAEWTTLVLPIAAAAVVVLSADIRAARRDRVHSTPAAWCAHCDTALYADHAGRYYSTPSGYLCPPERRQPGQRRHQPGGATR